MNYRYKLADVPANSGLLYRALGGVTLRKDRWLLSEKKLSLTGYEDWVIEEEELPHTERVPVQMTTSDKVVIEPEKEIPTKQSLMKKLKERGFPNKEIRGLSVEKMIEMLKIDKEISNGRD